MKTNLFMIIICLIVIIVRAAEPLKCWSCSGFFEPGCDDPFKPDDLAAERFLANCNVLETNGSRDDQRLMDHIFGPGAKAYCRKTILKAHGMTIVHRGCSYGDVLRDCTESSHECDSKACFKDGCNVGAAMTRSAIYHIVFSVTHIILLWLFTFDY